MDDPTVVNSGICLKCSCPTTNIADGQQRPFCHECEEELNAMILKGKMGQKFKKGKLYFPPAKNNNEEI